MSQTKILIDSNSYFRLAQNIHPLLSSPFGEEQFTLYVHRDLMSEFKRQPRLQTRFHWVSGSAYVQNRSRTLFLSKLQQEEIEQVFGYMWAHVQDEGLGPSPVDTRILATASALTLHVVTDDADMLELAAMYGVHAMTSLELMKLMMEADHIDMEKVRQIVAQWIYDNDTPANFEKNYRELFGEKPPCE
jgi:predicted nuclease of predicted toxin-antitoxin system